MTIKKQTPRKPLAKRVEFSWKLMSDLCIKAETNELLRKALKKLANSSDKTLVRFLGKKIMKFGGLKKVVFDIELGETKSFNISSFFKTKTEGGIWAYVDNDIARWFEDEVKNSQAKDLSSYEFTEDITEENIIGDAKAGEIYEEVDFFHIKSVCERHIIKGEKLLNEKGKNLFWTRNKSGDLCKVFVLSGSGGWKVSVDLFNPRGKWGLGNRSFFRN